MLLLLKKIVKILYDVLSLMMRIVILNTISFYRTFVVKNPRKCVKNQVVLMTGGGGGLGRELAIRFAKLGAVLVLWDINEIAVEKTARMIEEAGGIAHHYKCDVSDENHVTEVAKKVFIDVGEVDILINNAGIFNCRKLFDLSDQQIRKTIEINLLAHYWTIRQFLPKMLERNSGQIVAIASVAGLHGRENMADYSGSKFGVIGMMEAIDEELNLTHHGHNIKLTTLMPLAFKDGLAQKVTARFRLATPILKLETMSSLAVDAILRNELKVTLPRNIGILLKYYSFLMSHSATKEALRFFEYRFKEHV